MSATAVVDLVTGLAAADPAECDRDGLTDLVHRTQQVRSWLDAFEARIATHAARLQEPTVDLLASGGRRSARDAQLAAHRAVACALIPQLHDALASGTVA